MKTEEEWKPVVGYEGRYDISNLGALRTWLRGGRTDQLRKVPRILKGGYDSNGYHSALLTDSEGAIRRKFVHLLVLEAFTGPKPEEDSQGLHRNGVRLDNRAANLRWGTRSENMKDCVEHGTDNRGTKHWNALLSEDDVREIRAQAGSVRNRELSKTFGVCESMISNIIKRKAWSHVE